MTGIEEGVWIFRYRINNWIQRAIDDWDSKAFGILFAIDNGRISFGSLDGLWIREVFFEAIVHVEVNTLVHFVFELRTTPSAQMLCEVVRECDGGVMQEIKRVNRFPNWE